MELYSGIEGTKPAVRQWETFIHTALSDLDLIKHAIEHALYILQKNPPITF